MTISVDEIELKYDAPNGTVLPPLDGLPEVAAESDPDEQSLEARYYDTADLRLLRAGITLRRRRGGSDAGWHLKLPIGPAARREIRLPLSRRGSRSSPVPAELAALVHARTRREPLQPVAIIRTNRRRRLLLDNAGSSLAELVADEVSAETLGDSTSISHWYEVEVELTGGGRDLLDAADERLRRGGLQRAANAAKLERALAGQLPPAAARRRLTRRSSAGEVVLRYLSDQAETLAAMDPMVRQDEPDAVHQMRVAARRLRAALQAFAPLLRGPRRELLTAELRWLGGVLGVPRDTEVLSLRLQRQLAEIPADLVLGAPAERLRLHFAPLAADGRKALLAALDSERYLDLLDSLDELLADPPLTPRAARPAAAVLPALVGGCYRRVARRLRKAPAIPGPDRDSALHDARKAAKQARYAAEAVSPALGGRAQRFAGQMKELQTVLGDHQDAVIARGVDRELGISAHLAGDNAFTFGLLHERERVAALQLHDQARQEWQRASRPQYRRWIR